NIEPAVYVADVHAKTREIGRLERLTQDRLAVGSPLVGTALPFVVSQPLQPADLARFRMDIGHVNRRLNIRANEHGVLSVGGHIDDRLPVRSARETYRSAPWPSGPSIDFERPHVGLALIRRLLRP